MFGFFPAAGGDPGTVCVVDGKAFGCGSDLDSLSAMSDADIVQAVIEGDLPRARNTPLLQRSGFGLLARRNLLSRKSRRVVVLGEEMLLGQSSG